MLKFIHNLNLYIFIVFIVLYFYRNIYIAIALHSERTIKKSIIPNKLHKYAAIIAARNEQAVIEELIKSIQSQKYPKEFIDIFVVADNCIDNTAQIARNAGAIVYERNNQNFKGKGYALNFLFKIIAQEHSQEDYEGYFVFDADNILDEIYISEMNKCFDQGFNVITSYRNSKNYGYNWITAGYGLWFLHEAEFLNNPRMILGKSCAISGTGFLIHSDVIKRNGGWKHFLLTEDIEFTISEVIKGETIGYCGSAMLYDEQPTTFEQSWNQRLRWAKGFYQVFNRYGKEIFICSLQSKKQSFSCYDMMMTIMPAILVTIVSIFVNGLFLVIGLLTPTLGQDIIKETLSAIYSSFGIYYCILFILGLITTITEWQNIYCSSVKKILYMFSFPLFMFTYMPIAIVALFKKVEWNPVEHTCVTSLQEIRRRSI